MIVDHELLDAVIVQIVVGDGVSGQDCCVDHAGGNQCARCFGNTVEGNLFVEEFCSEHNNFVLVLRYFNDLNTDIGS